MVEAYFAELRTIVPGFDPALASPPVPSDFEPPNGTVVVVMVGDEAVGCGALRRLPASGASGPDRAGDTGELRRMWVRPQWRGRGVGRFLVEALENVAKEMAMSELLLDTRGELDAALGLYRSAGFHEVPRYNDNEVADYWFAKRL